ncbi:Hpt domain-containing protein [Oceanicoccus sagamiensis]|uniref:Hpt domain-containing protein n=1 Tax=Oceanicoccus sagamiensis TaxID=716816 RepID=UPI00198198B3|nr:Hpt domain-containing protein [Oceanicoccus sagamiensis]
MAIDLEQFHQVFFEESLEGLDGMEQTLLSIDSSGADSEAINTIFRAAHSIKGGSGTFGFDAITEFTHVAETLLDEVRDNKRELTPEIIELLLQSCDCLRNMISALQAGQSIDNADSKPLVQHFERLLGITPTAAAPVPEPAAEVTTTTASNDHGDILANSIDNLLSGGNNEAEPASQAPLNPPLTVTGR